MIITPIDAPRFRQREQIVGERWKATREAELAARGRSTRARGTREPRMIAKFRSTRDHRAGERERESIVITAIDGRDRKNMFGSIACLYDTM